MKELIVIGGPNGAGKTTTVRELLVENSDYPYLGADQIAAELAPDDVASVQVEAGREFLRRIDEHLRAGKSFIVESTLSGKSFVKTLHRAATLGYEIRIIFVFVDSADTCVNRVRERVRGGGHHVPEDDIRRRFTRSLSNFWTLYRPGADSWSLCYNSLSEMVAVAEGMDEPTEIFEPELFRRYLELAEVTDE